MYIKLNKCSSIFGVWLDEWIHVNAKRSYRFLLLCDTLMQRVHYHDEQCYCNRCRNHELITVIPSYLDQILIRVIVLYGIVIEIDLDRINPTLCWYFLRSPTIPLQNFMKQWSQSYPIISYRNWACRFLGNTSKRIYTYQIV